MWYYPVQNFLHNGIKMPEEKIQKEIGEIAEKAIGDFKNAWDASEDFERYGFEDDIADELIRGVVKAFMEADDTRKPLHVALFVQRFLDFYSDYYEKNNPNAAEPACEPGCDLCCRLPVILSAPEALIVGQYVKEKFDERERVKFIERAQKKLDDVRKGENPFGPCPFLENRRCSVYEVRPLSCRKWHSMSKNKCVESFESPDSGGLGAEIDPARARIFDTAIDALFCALKALPVQNAYFELSETLVQYFENNSPLQSWARGEEVFALREEAG